jgi:hypothetical protein
MPTDLWTTALLAILTVAQTIHIVVKRRQERLAKSVEPEVERRRYDVRLERRLTQIESALMALTIRMDRAGKELSALATKLQAMPQELQRDFLDLGLGQEWANQCKTDRQRLWDELARMRGPTRMVDRR